MPARRIGEAQEIRRIEVRIHGPRIEVIEEVGHTQAECHSFTVSEWNRNLFFKASVHRDECRHLIGVVTADNVIQIVDRRIGETRSRFDRKRAV